MNRRHQTPFSAFCVLAASTSIGASSLSAASTWIPITFASYQSARILDRSEHRSSVAVTRNELAEARWTLLELQRREPIVSERVDGAVEMSLGRSDRSDGLGALIGVEVTCAVWPDHIAIMMPLDSWFLGVEFHPTVIGSLRPSRHLEITASASRYFLFWDQDAPISSYTVGLGMSKDLQRWALRPELGWLRSPDHRWSLTQFGIGLEWAVDIAGKR